MVLCEMHNHEVERKELADKREMSMCTHTHTHRCEPKSVCADLLLSFWSWSIIPLFEVPLSAVIDQVKTQGWPNRNTNQPCSPFFLLVTLQHRDCEFLCITMLRHIFHSSFVSCSNLQGNIISSINIQWRRVGSQLSL